MKASEITDEIGDKEFGGVVTVEVIRDGADGPKVIQRREVHNLVVNQGKRQTWRMAAGLNSNDWDQFRIGTNGAAANSGHNNVQSPVTGTINTADQKTLLAGTRTFQLMISYPSGVSSKSATNIQEVCILNKNTSSSTASCFMRATFTAIAKSRSDKLKITYNVRIA